MQHLIEFLIVHIVKHPEEVEIERSQEEYGAVYTIHANEEDIGRIIGHNGRTIKAIRSIAKILAVPQNERFQLEIAD